MDGVSSFLFMLYRYSDFAGLTDLAKSLMSQSSASMGSASMQTSLTDKGDKLAGIAGEARNAGQTALKGAGKFTYAGEMMEPTLHCAQCVLLHDIN